MMFTRSTSIALLASLFVGVSALESGLTILSPGGSDLWWVAESVNTLLWTCQTSPVQTFTVLIANPTVLVSPAPIISILNNFDCSETIAQNLVNQVPGTGYTVQLANPFNSTDVYAESEPFEIKAQGSTYPLASSTPTVSGSASNTASGSSAASGTSSSASTSQTAGGSSNGALDVTASLGGLASFVAAVAALVIA